MQDGLSAEEVAALRASRERLVLAADADRRRLERELHDGLQQQLVALAVGMQLALASLESEPAAARAAMDELRAEVDQAIAQAARLAGRLSAPPPGIGGLAVALRAAAASAGVPASVEVSAGTGYPPQAVQTLHACWLEALDHAEPSIGAREESGELVFEVRCGPGAGFDGLADRVEALGGRLTIEGDASGTRVSGSLPL